MYTVWNVFELGIPCMATINQLLVIILALRAIGTARRGCVAARHAGRGGGGGAGGGGGQSAHIGSGLHNRHIPIRGILDSASQLSRPPETECACEPCCSGGAVWRSQLS